jgi:photosynthetic reaction center cytochrome c subunit
MVRDLNTTVMQPLLGTLPPERVGPTGDVPKIYCATCHQGVNKPLYGAPMLKDYPELIRPATTPAPSPGEPGTAPAALPVPLKTAYRSPAATPVAAGGE